jgi:hypothetical protein
MAELIHQGTQRTILLSVVRADGSAGVVEGSPVWSVNPPELGSLVPSVDGLSAVLTWAGVGEGIITATADGDLGEGIFPIIVTEVVTFVAPLGAVAGSFTFTPEAPV